MIRGPNSCGRLVLHLVRFSCLSGEVKVGESSEFKNMSLRIFVAVFAGVDNNNNNKFGIYLAPHQRSCS